MRQVCTLVVFLSLLSTAAADEGMWLLNQPPRALLKKKYDFDLTASWLERVQKASVRLNNGGSGSFVSPHGLLITNHHVGADALQKLGTKERDLYRDGFLARTHAEELKCPDLELNVLQEIEDVTERVREAVKPNLPAAEALAARKAIIARITKESLEKTGLRSDVVTLYHGGLYHLYRYKKYTDVRLVFAPENAIASFGGDVDNFEFPRYNLDVCFFRVYEGNKPADTKHFFPWSQSGPKEGDLVFVSGHPGTTNRLETWDRLCHRRDVLLPYTLGLLRYREALLQQYSETSPEARRQAKVELYGTANARKALTGQFHGLLDPAVFHAKSKLDDNLRAAYRKAHAKSAKAGPDPWTEISKIQAELRDTERQFALIEKGDAFDSRLFRIARHLVRLAREMPKDDAKRLPEYRSAALESLKFQLFSPAPIYKELEKVKLAGSLAFFAEMRGGGDPLVQGVALEYKSPRARAAELVDGCTLDDVANRKKLFDGGAAISSTDPMIRFASEMEHDAKLFRSLHDTFDEAQQQAYARIANFLFTQYGTDIPPDATFTLRLAFGVVKSYSEDGKNIPYATTLAGLFERAQEHGFREPFNLPKRWLDGKAKLDLSTPFNFVSTADTIGGNSGSPILNRAGEFVGINFDRNRHGLSRNFVYTEEQARHISVHVASVTEALRKLYGADELLKELQPK